MLGLQKLYQQGLRPLKVKFLIILLFLTINIYSQNSDVAEIAEDDEIERIDETTLQINAEGTPRPVVTVEDNPIGITDYLVVVLVLVVVLIALYFVLKLIRKIGGSRIGIDNDLIHVISTRALKGTTALHLVEVGKQIFLIGATDTSVNSIAEITEQETKDMIALNLSVDNTENKTFVQFFAEKLQNLNGSTGQEQAKKPDLKTQKEKLDRF